MVRLRSPAGDTITPAAVPSGAESDGIHHGHVHGLDVCIWE
tara:strand:+ start:339 stop:461 length:123 start_codon:yes stop_codon:yes gene_type:complete